jgi:hypothetical protein
MQTFVLEQHRAFVLSTELCPAILIRTESASITLFGNLRAWGLGAPAACFVPVSGGAQSLRTGETSRAVPAQAWLLVSFAGATGWRYFDAPVLVVLQHRPQSIRLDEDGLHLQFARKGGDIVVALLYGYEKPLQKDVSFPVKTRLEAVKTWQWQNGLPKEVQGRCSRLCRILRAFPIYADERFTIEGDDLILQTRYTYHVVRDDWNTPAVKLAPLPPVLALAWLAGQQGWAKKPFPMQVEGTIEDPDIMTPYGPWLGVRDADTFTIRFPLLRYVHTHEQYPLPSGQLHPVPQRALDWVRERLSQKFATEDWQQVWDHGGAENYCWQVMGDRWYAKALPYLPHPVQQRVKASLQGYMRQHVLREEHYQPFRGMLLLVGPGIGTWGGYDDAGKFSSNLLETLWCYAHYTQDWETIRQHWKTIQKFFITPLECDWKSFGRYAIAELGDEAAPPLYMARMAYQVGDHETYRFACYIFVRELVHHYVKQVGHRYFVQRQPWHSMEPMPENVYLTNLWGDIAGWQIDGPTYPRQTGERQFENRWVRFGSEDVARFYRDVLLDEVRAELDWLRQLAREDKTPYRLHEDTAHIAPSQVRLRSLLLREPIEQLAELSPLDRWQLGRAADGTAFCLSVLYAASQPSVQRLIPLQKRVPFRKGLEPLVADSFPSLTLAVEAERGYPVLRWWAWEPPRKAQGVPAGDRWSFGMVQVPGWDAAAWRRVRLNWNTAIWVP